MGDLRILSGGAANGLVTALTPLIRQTTGLGVTGDYGAVGGMRDRILSGEGVDVIILTRAIVDHLIEAGHAVAGSAVDLGQVVTGIAVREGAPAPDVTTAKSLRAVLYGADGLYYPDPVKATAGIHFAKVLAALGIAEQVAERSHTFPNGQTTMAAMAASGDDAPIGCTQITEILNTPGVAYAGDLPPEHGLVTTYTAVVAQRAADAGAAAAMIALLSAPEQAQTRTDAGFSG